MTQLSAVVASGVTTVIWAGDAEYVHSIPASLHNVSIPILTLQSWICNWIGVADVADAISYSGQAAFKAKALAPYKVNGVEGGTFKTQGNLSFLRVYEAGHEVMYYRKLNTTDGWEREGRCANGEIEPALSLQVFIQTMKKGAIAST